MSRAPSLFGSRWKAVIRQLDVADRVAYRLLLQAPWPTATDLMEFDEAMQLVARAMPEHADIERRGRELDAAIKACPQAHEIWANLEGDLLAHTEHYAFILGWALGARMGPQALKAPAGRS